MLNSSPLPFRACSLALLALGRLAPLHAAAPAEAAGGDVISLNAFTVSSAKDRGYVAANSVTATGIGTAIVDIPIAINVVTEEFLRDSLSLNLIEALVRIPSFNGNSRFDERSQLRGNFALQLRNGFSSGISAHGTDSIARYEVIKGPSSVFHGLVGPGGVVNYLTKAPLARPETTIRATYGSNSFVKGLLDTSGFVTADGRLKYRAVVSRSDSEGWRDHTYTKDDGYYGSVLWQATDRVELRVNIDYNNHRSNPGTLFPATHTAYMGNPAAIASNLNQQSWGRANLGATASNLDTYVPALFGPPERNPGGIGQHRNTRAKSADTAVTVRLIDWLAFQNAWEFAERVFTHNELAGFFRPFADGSVRNVGLTDQRQETDGISVRTELVAKFSVAGTHHKLLLGHAGQQVRSYVFRRTGTTIARWTAANAELDLDALYAGRTFSPSSSSFAQTEGVYLNDQVALAGDRVRLFAGVRHTEFVTQSKNGAGLSQPKLSQDKSTPQFGLSATIRPGLNIFANYSQAFLTNGVIDPIRGPLGARPGEGREAGLKFDTVGGRWSGTVSYFENSESNQPITDFFLTNQINDGRQYYQPAGASTDIKGAEAEVFFTPSSRLQLVAAYSYIPHATTFTAETAPAAPGLPLFVFTTNVRTYQTPKHSCSLWSRYTVESGPLKGLSFGGGPNYVGKHTSQRSLYSLGLINPAVTLWDAFVNYRVKRGRTTWDFALNAKNLADELYWIGDIYVAERRRVYFSTGLRF